ncbi:MAG: glycosyltransferase [Bifidobacteriaceae bacterium]|jgi:glycogen(starch) synthase|nr:glycosyltransferase [Bifidobacteriaceae bacterium]
MSALTGPLVVPTPWYPTSDRPYFGAFVRQWVRALGLPSDQVTVIHLEMVEPDDPRLASERAEPEGRLIWVPVKVGHRLPRAEAAEAQANGIVGAGLEALRAAEVVFAHVVMPTGVAVARHLRPGQRLVLVEHASYLPQLLRRPETRALYGQAVDLSDAVLTVGEAGAALIGRAFPAAGAKTWAVGNPVDADAFPYVERPAEGGLRRWLYVGNLLDTKGVFEVLDGFRAYAAAVGSRGTSLTFVGDGPARGELEDRARRAGRSHRVAFAGALTAPEVAAAMAQADVQIHLSPAETFGLAPLEGLLTGLPLVVARNDGTAQTMGPALAAGRAVMIDRPAGWRGAARVAQAVRRLERQLSHSDPRAALTVREEIVGRYGLAQFGAMERRVAAGLPPF